MNPQVCLGLISQDVEPLVPEAVVRDLANPETPWGLTYTTFIPVLIKAVQEQQGIIQTQKDEIAALEARLGRLEKLIVKPSVVGAQEKP